MYFIGNTREALEGHMKSIHKESQSENSENKNKNTEKYEELVENEYSQESEKCCNKEKKRNDV